MFIPLQNNDKLKCLVDKDSKYLLEYKWFIDKHGYIITRKNKRNIYIQRMIMNTPKGLETDHINHDKLDNRKSNLRICTKSENQHNRKIGVNNKSGFKGVSWSKHGNNWEVRIVVNNKKKFLGRFNDLIEAGKVYDKKASEFFGEFACLNFKKVVRKDVEKEINGN
jgi:hypothetical protein